MGGKIAIFGAAGRDEIVGREKTKKYFVTQRRGDMLPDNYETFASAGGAPVKSWTRGVSFDENAKAQVLNAAKLPFIFKWIAVMPDVHSGIGATVGSVIPTRRAIIPAAVGVDIGC